MPDTTPLFDLNDHLDPLALRAQFTGAQRLQIPNFFPVQTAKEITENLTGLEWRLVLNDAGKHFDIHPLQIKALGPEKTALIIEAAKARANYGFQYLYENYPIADMEASGNLENSCLSRLYRTMNAPPVLNFLNQVTNKEAKFCDMQATCYRAGHFLTRHDDGNVGKNRVFAYVYSLARNWQADWGGQLQFFDGNDDIEASFIPGYNSLSIFNVPYPHHVTHIADFVTAPRYSITGWFRTGPRVL